MMKDRLAALFEIGKHPLAEQSRAVLPATGYALTRLTFSTAGGESVRGFYCRPLKTTGPIAAVLVIHAHGNRYDIGARELLHGRPALHEPMGPALAKAGIASLCLDMPCFGQRAGMTESAASKAALWQGRSLAGQMMGECHAAMDWLTVQPDLQSDRIGVFGISMGATLAYWLAAVDDRVRAVAHECCLADFARLIALGAHDLHGIYLTVPGLLNTASNGQIAGLVAPRAQFVGLGDTDPLTPPEAADIALGEIEAAYAQAGGTMVLHRETGSGHVETPAMRVAAMEFLKRELS